MINRRQEGDVIIKFKIFRSVFDKLFISIAGSLWIFATLWDIYKLQRYWLDYAIEFYSSFFIFYMMLFSINPKSLPIKIYNSFKIITTISGRGTMLIIISSLFLSDKHAFHKTCAILFFLGGIIYIICEFLVPTTKEEINIIDSYYNKNINNEKTINKSQITNMSNNVNIKADASTAVFVNNTNNNFINNSINNNDNVGDNTNKENNENKNDLINEEDPENSNNKAIVNNIEAEMNNTEEKENNNNSITNSENNNNIFENEIIRKTDNPYEIPDDF
jgi:hypothetical protein